MGYTKENQAIIYIQCNIEQVSSRIETNFKIEIKKNSRK
jgi:hypothetical protein